MSRDLKRSAPKGSDGKTMREGAAVIEALAYAIEQKAKEREGSNREAGRFTPEAIRAMAEPLRADSELSAMLTAPPSVQSWARRRTMVDADRAFLEWAVERFVKCLGKLRRFSVRAIVEEAKPERLARLQKDLPKDIAFLRDLESALKERV